MNIYDIYEHPRWGLIAVPQGFSWPAFLAPSVWAAAVGLGALTLGLVAYSTVMFNLLRLASAAIANPMMMLALFVSAYVVFGLRPGIDGNHWRALRLRQEGYRWKYAVAAHSRNDAVRAVRDGRAVQSDCLLLAADDLCLA